MMRIYAILFLLFSTSAFSQNWTQVSDLPIGRHHPVTFAIDGKGYSVTGTLTNSSYSKSFLEYDPALDSWTVLPAFPGAARSFAIGAAYEGKGYLGFGVDNNTDFNDLWVFDPATYQWTQLATCPCQGRSHPAFVIANDHIYVGLGGSDFGDLKDWWMYSINSDSWTQLPDLPGPRRHHPFMFEADGNVYAGMGHGGPVIYDDWYMLDTATLQWTIMNDFPGEARVAGTQFGNNGMGYVLSGDGDDHSFMNTGEFWEYDPTTDNWSQLPPHPGISRWAPNSFVIDDVVYFLGGYNRQVGFFPTDVWAYDFSPSTVGVKNESIEGLTLYPNPTSDFLFIQGATENLTVEIFSMTGQILGSFNTSTGNRIDLSGFPSGVYQLKLSDGNETQFKRVVVE
jgi:N-acetylneuraminic acid mutarotase